jgi:hypothetical protein
VEWTRQTAAQMNDIIFLWIKGSVCRRLWWGFKRFFENVAENYRSIIAKNATQYRTHT